MAINKGTVAQPRFVNVDISEVFDVRGFNFDNNTKLQPQIATDGAYLRIERSTPLMVIPGENYEHHVVITDDLGQKVDTSLRVAIINEPGNNVKLDSALSSSISDEIQLTGKENNTATMYLETISPRQRYIKVEVKLRRCPPGFEANNDSKCVCNAHKHFGLLKCDEEGFYSYLLPGFWMGRVDSTVITGACPFCDYRSITSEYEVILPQDYAEIDRTVCGETRTGILCGRCRDNFTVHFHSPGFRCKLADPAGCKFGWLFYIFSELVPVTVVFIIVLSLNVSFTSGTVNGFILFSQLLGSLDIYAGGIINIHNSTLDNVVAGYQILYGFINLDFFNAEFLSFCLWKGASALDMIALKYITVVYTLVMILVVIWSMDKCGGRWLSRYFRITTIKTSIIHGISAFLIISYAQCINVSLKLLVRVHIYAEHKSNVVVKPRVWFNGEFIHFSKQHLPYALLSFFFLFTIGICPPLLLLMYPLVNKGVAFLGFEDSKGLKVICGILPFQRLKPLFDSFQGCFKDNFRFFAGLYFLYRLTILLAYLYSEFSVYYISVIAALCFILSLHSICQPYTMRSHNIMDTLLFLNLILITSFSLFNYHRSQRQKLRERDFKSAAVIQIILIYLPLSVLGIYLVVILCKLVLKIGSKKIMVINSNQSHKLEEVVYTRKIDSNEGFSRDGGDDEDFMYRSTCNYEKWKK